MTGLATLDFYSGTSPGHSKLHTLLQTNCCRLSATITGYSVKTKYYLIVTSFIFMVHGSKYLVHTFIYTSQNKAQNLYIKSRHKTMRSQNNNKHFFYFYIIQSSIILFKNRFQFAYYAQPEDDFETL